MITVGGTSRRLGTALRDRRPVCAEDGPRWLPGSVEETLLRRRSVREFSADPLPVSRVRAAIAAARDAEAAAWPARSHGAVTFEILVAAFRVDGLPRGLFAIRDSCPAELAGPQSIWLDSLRGQYADAPALLLICADLNHACRVAGPAGYSSTLVRAGTIGYAAWLWAISAGLAGSVYGVASHEVTGAARRLDANYRHLFTVAFGAPAPPGRPLSAGS
jgi:nitroreductase